MTNMHRLPLDEDDQDAQNNLMSTIIAKSKGYFLWVKLIVDQLNHFYSSSGIRKVLAGRYGIFVYQNYRDAIWSRSEKIHCNSDITLTVCIKCPFSTDELRCGLQLDINDKVFNLANIITCACGELVYVDNYSRARMVHWTAREFLLNLDQSDELFIRLEKGMGGSRLSA